MAMIVMTVEDKERKMRRINKITLNFFLFYKFALSGNKVTLPLTIRTCSHKMREFDVDGIPIFSGMLS